MPSSAPPKPPERSLASVALLVGVMLAVPALAIVAVRAWKPAVRPVPSGVASVSAAPAPVDAAPPEDRTPEIFGHIVDADGNAASGATVRLVSASPPYTVYADTKSDAAGAFSFSHVGPWRVRVVADRDPDGIVTSAALRVEAGESKEITLVLSSAGAVRGTVVDANDHPVSGAVVSVEGVPWIVPAATSDEAGAFRLPTVPDEASSLVAVARGFKTAHAALGARDDQTELVVRLVLSAADPVKGRVLDDGGNPVKARVVACEEQPSEARAESEADGTFELPASAIGCDAVAEHAEFAPSDATPVVEGGRLLLRLKTGGAIDGVVVDDHGAALESVTVGIESFTPSRGRPFERAAPRAVDDPRGAFHWDKLAPGTYVLTASAPGRAPARSSPLDVRGGAVTGGVRIVLSVGGTLTGHVFDESHAPLAGVDLRFDAVSSVVDSKSAAQTDEAGKYRLEGAPSGPLTLRVHKDGYRLKLVSGLRVDSGATLVQDITLAAIDGGGEMELGGIGAQLTQRGGAIVIAAIFDGDPAARAGLRRGDRIVRIDGESTVGMSLADALQRLRGAPGTTVGVSAERPESGETVEIAIERGLIVH